MPKVNILVVEDEDAIRDLLTLILQQAGFTSQAVNSLTEAKKALADIYPDLILLDWMLPDGSGIDWLRSLKKHESYKSLPVLVLTARGEEEDKVKGLEGGADDYITKPFSPKELIARIRAVLRRAGTTTEINDILTFGALTLNTQQHTFTINKQQVDVSPTEFRMLQFFMSHPDKVFNRSQLLDQIWGRSVFIEERTVDVHIRRLRKVLDEYQCGDLLQTVRGFGYKFSHAPAHFLSDHDVITPEAN